MNETVSAVIPTYNRAHLLPDAIRSVLAQTEAVTEILIVDDGSTDDTAHVVEQFTGPIRYIRQPNAGPAAARNRGMREARGDFIAFLDSDDLWVPEKTAVQLRFFRDTPAADFVFGDMANFASETDRLEPEIKNQASHEYFVSNATNLESLFERLITENMIPTPTVMYRRASIQKVGFFDETLRIVEDLEYWLRVSLQCRCGFINAVMAKRRRHEGNLINNWAECTKRHAEVLTRAAQLYTQITPHARTLIRKKVAHLYYDLGSFYFAQRAFRKSSRCFQLGQPRHAADVKWLFKLGAAQVLAFGFSSS